VVFYCDVALFVRNDAMFAKIISEATSLGEAVIISDSVIICRKTNIIEKKSLLSEDKRDFFRAKD